MRYSKHNQNRSAKNVKIKKKQNYWNINKPGGLHVNASAPYYKILNFYAINKVCT